jgi:predicted nucleic acid-binding protein
MPIDRVVVNASPLICLSKAELTHLLPALFNKVVVPGHVFMEVTIKGDALSITGERPPEWLHLADIATIPAIIASWDLGAGESSVLAYALQDTACWAIIDDREARRCAAAIGCKYTGTVGVIMLAKRLGIVPSVRDCLDKLRDAGLWMSEAFIADILIKAGER